MKLKLYFFRSTQYPKEYISIFSTLEPGQIKTYSNQWDSGGMDYEVYNTCWEGISEEITSPDGLNLYEIPLSTDEKVNCNELGGDYLNLGDLNIGEFFENYYDKEF